MSSIASRAARIGKAKNALVEMLEARGFAPPPTSKDKDIDTALLLEYTVDCLDTRERQSDDNQGASPEQNLPQSDAETEQPKKRPRGRPRKVK